MKSLYEKTGSAGVRTGFDLEQAWLGSSAAVFAVPNRLALNISLLECLLNQPKGWDPFRPQTDFCQRLRYEVARHLSKSRALQLGLYVSVGQSLDRFHGVDAFFFLGERRNLEQARNRRRFFTIDVCLYPKPIDDIKADILITPENLLGRNHDLRKIGLTIACYYKGGKRLGNPARFNPESLRASSSRCCV